MARWSGLFVRRQHLRTTVAVLVPVLGLTLGAGIVSTSPFQELPGWPAWAALAIALTTAAAPWSSSPSWAARPRLG